MTSKVDSIVRDLCKWLKENDYDIETKTELKLIQSENIYEGRCVISNKNFKPNSVLIEFPHKFLINYRLAFKNESFIKFFDWYAENYLKKNPKSNLNLNRLDALYLLIIEQKFTENSFLSKFINSMPLSYDTPEYFDNDLIDYLPECFRIDIKKRLDKLDSKFNFISTILNEYATQCQDKSIQILSQNFTKENFRWIFCTINTRCFHAKESEICDKKEILLANKYFAILSESDGELDQNLVCNSIEEYEEKLESNENIRNSLCCIIPYLDFINHSNISNVYSIFDEKTKSYVLLSQDSDDEKSLVRENEQIYITYGHHDNKTLYIEYGFILDDNIYDKICFCFRDFKSLIDTDLENENFLWSCAIQKNLLNDLSCNKVEGPSWSLLKLLDLIYCMNKENEMKNSKQTKKQRGTNDELNFYEIQNVNKVKELFTKLIERYKNDLEQSLDNFKKFDKCRMDKYHYVMSKKLIDIYLDIIDSNFTLVNDDEKWAMLF